MWSDTVVLSESGDDDALSLFRGVEPFGIFDFAAQISIEPFIIAPLPQ